MKTALLVGGTAATGVAIAAELRQRGYEVTVYHRGIHEVPDLLDLEHIHGDPHQQESISRDLRERSWDVTISTYGRVRLLAESLRGRTGHFLSVSGTPVVSTQPGVPVREDHRYVTDQDAPLGLKRLAPRIIETEEAVLGAHARGDFVATVVRYPYVYGPYSVVPMEWHVIQRVIDKRQFWILHDGGLALSGRCAAPNAARVVALALETPSVSGGQIYHAADTRQFTQREWIGLVANVMGHEFEFVDLPPSVAPLGMTSVPMAGEYTWSPSLDIDEGRLKHVLVSNEKARLDLGYCDAVAPAVWIARTVEYWLANPPLLDGCDGRYGRNDFDYEAEDRLLAFWRSVTTKVPTFGSRLVRAHPYDHPPEQTRLER